MRTNDPMKWMAIQLLPLGLAALLAVRCTSEEPHHVNGDLRDPSTMSAPPGSITVDNEADARANAAQERIEATNDLQMMRATLMAELERVRDRLNVGEREEFLRDADQERASELALGLERIDRALVALGTDTDDTWKHVRASRLREVQQVRAWMRAHPSDELSASR